MRINGDFARLTQEDIRERIKVFSAKPENRHIHPRTDQMRKAAVLVPLFKQSDVWNLLLTRRTETVQDHKGQVAFPGGSWEPEDPSLEQTSIREAWEEIGLIPENVCILGALPDVQTITAYNISPFVAEINWPFTPVLSREEVSHIFSIPLSWLADPSNFEERPFTHPVTGEVHQVIYYQSFQGEILWGISGRITVELMKALLLLPQ